jgi:hypothetical protein
MNRAIRVRNSPVITSNGATSRLNYSELWTNVGTGVTNLTFNPGKSGMTKLDMFGQNWEQYKVIKANISFKTSSGTTTAGHFVAGIDYSTTNPATSITDVFALDPRVDGPVWNNLALHVDPRKAMTKEIMYCNRADAENTAFNLSIYSDTPTSGIIICDYVVDFSSPRHSSQVGSVLASATSVVDASLTTHIVAIGQPDVNVEAEFDGAQALISPKNNNVTSQFRLEEGASTGKQYCISSTGNNAQNSTVSVSFVDAVTMNPLPSSVVHQVSNSSANGFFTAVWQFIRPWIRPILLTVVEAVAPANTVQSALTNEVSHIITDIPPASITSSVPTIIGVGNPSQGATGFTTAGAAISGDFYHEGKASQIGTFSLASGIITSIVSSPNDSSITLRAGNEYLVAGTCSVLNSTTTITNTSYCTSINVWGGANSGFFVVTLLQDVPPNTPFCSLVCNLSTTTVGGIYFFHVQPIGQSTARINPGSLPALTFG